jgi:hypothetical protein
MAIEKKTVVDKVEVDRNNVVSVRFARLLVEDGKEIATEYHRAVVEPGTDIDRLLAAVNKSIVDDLRGAAVSEGTDLIRTVAGIVHTPEVVATYMEARAARKEAEAVRLVATR